MDGGNLALPSTPLQHRLVARVLMNWSSDESLHRLASLAHFLLRSPSGIPCASKIRGLKATELLEEQSLPASCCLQIRPEASQNSSHGTAWSQDLLFASSSMARPRLVGASGLHGELPT